MCHCLMCSVYMDNSFSVPAGPSQLCFAFLSFSLLGYLCVMPLGPAVLLPALFLARLSSAPFFATDPYLRWIISFQLFLWGAQL